MPMQCMYYVIVFIEMFTIDYDIVQIALRYRTSSFIMS